MTRLYLGNLPWRITEQELIDAFQGYGVREGSVRIIKDRETGKSKGYGFIEVREGQKAIQEMNGKEVGGRPLKVAEAVRNQQRAANPSPYSRGF